MLLLLARHTLVFLLLVALLAATTSAGDQVRLLSWALFALTMDIVFPFVALIALFFVIVLSFGAAVALACVVEVLFAVNALPFFGLELPLLAFVAPSFVEILLFIRTFGTTAVLL